VIEHRLRRGEPMRTMTRRRGDASAEASKRTRVEIERILALEQRRRGMDYLSRLIQTMDQVRPGTR
jgi:hypothetical protein